MLFVDAERWLALGRLFMEGQERNHCARVHVHWLVLPWTLLQSEILSVTVRLLKPWSADHRESSLLTLYWGKTHDYYCKWRVTSYMKPDVI